jgi:hypothetical protein
MRDLSDWPDQASGSGLAVLSLDRGERVVPAARLVVPSVTGVYLWCRPCARRVRRWGAAAVCSDVIRYAGRYARAGVLLSAPLDPGARARLGGVPTVGVSSWPFMGRIGIFAGPSGGPIRRGVQTWMACRCVPIGPLGS